MIITSSDRNTSQELLTKQITLPSAGKEAPDDLCLDAALYEYKK